MAFNFGISAESAIKSVRKPLAPWAIHDVKFKGCEIREFDGKKDPSAHYKVLDIKFENENGYFTVTQFFPREGDDKRRVIEGSNGGKVEMPSNFEVLMALVKQTAQVLNPVGFEKMQKASAGFKSFDDVAKALIAVTKSAIDTDTKLKLIGRNKEGKVEAVIPRIVAINKNGESWISDNYIGNKLFFSDYEETQRMKYSKATPTEMPSENKDSLGIDTPSENQITLTDLADDTIDFGSLEGELV